jgi:hypothetical protein
VELQFSGGRRAVDAFPKRDKGDTERLEFLEEHNQVPEITPKSVQPPADDHVEPAASSISNEPIQRRPAVFRAAHATVHVLDGGPGACLDVTVQFLKLVGGLLIEGADAGVDGGTHREPFCTSATCGSSGSRYTGGQPGRPTQSRLTGQGRRRVSARRRPVSL